MVTVKQDRDEREYHHPWISISRPSDFNE